LYALKKIGLNVSKYCFDKSYGVSCAKYLLLQQALSGNSISVIVVMLDLGVNLAREG
jgi:hypothetical protein